MNIEDQDKIIEGLSQALSKAITGALRDLVRGLASPTTGASTIQLPAGPAGEAAQEQAPPIAIPTQKPSIRPQDLQNEFSTIPTEIVDRTPLELPGTVSYSTQPAYFPETVETPPKPVATRLTLPTPPDPVEPIPTPKPHAPLNAYSTLDFKRGFATDDPTGRMVFHHEQDAQANRYDQTTDLLYEAMVQQSRVDRDYRERQYDLTRRILQDANNDYRRIDDLERRHECSRENITDCNI